MTSSPLCSAITDDIMESKEDGKESETVQSTRSGASVMELKCMREIHASSAKASKHHEKTGKGEKGCTGSA